MQACKEQRPKKEIGGLIPGALDNSNNPKGSYNAQQALYQTSSESGVRRLHIALDNAARNADGGTDLNVGYNFVEVETLPENGRVPCSISPAARNEVFNRPLALNHQGANEEAAKAPAVKPKGADREKTAP
jgi:hypothetical protein